MVTLSSRSGRLVAPVVADPGIPPGVVSVPFCAPGGSASDLIAASEEVVTVTVAAAPAPTVGGAEPGGAGMGVAE